MPRNIEPLTSEEASEDSIQVQYVEREITLGLLNEKLNHLINKVEEISKKQ